MFLTLISLNLMTLLSPTTIEQQKTSTELKVCRMSCSVTWYDEAEETYITFSASAGGIFTSCDNALEKACDRAYASSNNWLENHR